MGMHMEAKGTPKNQQDRVCVWDGRVAAAQRIPSPIVRTAVRGEMGSDLPLRMIRRRHCSRTQLPGGNTHARRPGSCTFPALGRGPGDRGRFSEVLGRQFGGTR
ncbi:hypothetical protein GGTG_03666 [Gaeumannomyces tritici R3-111a-1]|uniref:Uncharacterized protein n=1 Tax=Gaeumannomyces tritici (strain R3-111a-1) TaxID=644352 RepID=J3NQW0_GAET3|nr:hypothetical protein GGTG_03666 [Gaeumannomyces tritici R3-111a-1]EJT78566.1 hypothetical protein GGTG_03666 [Gaeumannomyces tritici R3-111a-1]